MTALVATGFEQAANGLVPQTREWDGARWIVSALPAAPRALAWDSRWRTVVLSVRRVDAGVPDTWTWDGGTWALLPASDVVPQRGTVDRQRLLLLNDQGPRVSVP